MFYSFSSPTFEYHVPSNTQAKR